MIQTAREKAIELFEYYDELLTYIESKNIVKQCVLKAIQEARNVCPYIDADARETLEQLDAYNFHFVSFWEEVEQEVKKL
jgi:hypothetical protein